MDEQDIVIESDGTIRYVYSDALDSVFAGETRRTVRASHVEPVNVSAHEEPFVGWSADMGPSGGPVLGPFLTRQEALDAEREWLRTERGL